MKHFFACVGAFRKKLEPAAPRKLLFTVLLAFATGLELAAAVELISSQSLRGTFAWLAQQPLQVLAGTFFFGLLICFFAFLSRNLFVGGLIVSLVGLILCFVNYFKVLITNVPLSITDLLLAGQVGDIAALNANSLALTKHSIVGIVVTLLWLGVLLFLEKPLRLRWKWSLFSGLGSAGVFVLMMVVLVEPFFLTPMGVPLSVPLGQARVNVACGEVMGLWRGVLYQRKVVPPGDFSPAAMEQDLAEIRAIAAKDQAERPLKTVPEQKPNVILLLSESFFDVTKLPGVTYQGDPLQHFHALQDQSVSGTFHTRTLGYGTCNIELEILTGINSALFPQPLNLCYQSPDALAKLAPIPLLLQNQGYYTASLHTYNDEIYHRTPLFRAIGFQDTFFTDGFAAIDPAAAAAPNYYEYLANKMSGGAYSDAYLSDLITMLYQQKKDLGPVFLYGISMENHAPYNDQKYLGHYDYPLTAPALTKEAAEVLSSVTQGVVNADKALRQLVDYFSAQEDPTVIVFFGDHRPGLGMTDSSSLYSQLGLCHDPDSGAWTTDEIQSLYSTDYLIWSNDPAYLPDQPGTRRDTSSNYLGLDLLSCSGTPLPLFWQHLRTLPQVAQIWTDEYFLPVGKPAQFGATFASEEDHRKFLLLKRLIYDSFYGDRVITQALSSTG
ncbi:MAG: sulfatase-like hydrolase/transferase [Oscillospiraceae bacterium]